MSERYYHRNVAEKHCRYASKQRSPSTAHGRGSDRALEQKHLLEDWKCSPTFAFDVKGDFQNLHYGSNYGVPSYRRSSARRVLGSKSSLDYFTHHTTSSDQGKFTISKYIVNHLRHQRSKRIKAGSYVDQEVNTPDFIPLQQPRSRKRKLVDWTNAHTPFQNIGSLAHRPFEGQAETSPSSDDDDAENNTEESATDGDVAGVPVLDDHFERRRAAFSSKIEQDPADWQSWVGLLELQDEMNGFLSDSSQMRHTNAERRSNAEVALSICAKALKCVTDPYGRERLYLRQMSKAHQVWERGKILKRWRAILQEHPLCHRLWKNFLDFNQSTFASFGIEETRKQYSNCLDMLQAARNDFQAESAQQSRLFSIQVYIILRLTLLLSESGYVEIGLAIWQALLEFQFNKPQQPRRSLQQAAADSAYDESALAFEHFWNSENPRIGEPKAKGWFKFHDNELEYQQSSDITETLSQAKDISLKSWNEAERKVASTSRTPSRSIDKSSDDPFRFAFFVDIKVALVESPTPCDTHTILLALLSFCDLPPYLDTSKLCVESWFNDQFLRNEILYDQPTSVDFPLRGPRSKASNLENTGNSMPEKDNSSLSSAFPFGFPLVEHQISIDTLFSASPKWFSAFRRGVRRFGPVPKDFALRILKSMAYLGVGGDALAEYLLALELQISPATVKKSARSLLKTRLSSLRLYNAYALILNQLAEGHEASRVYETAIYMSKNLDESARRDVIILWQSRMWHHLSTGESVILVGQLLSFERDDDPKGGLNHEEDRSNDTSATAWLRLRKALSAGRDKMLSTGYTTHAVCYAELLVVSDYLLDTTTLKETQEAFRANLDILTKYHPTNRALEELLRQSFARLLYVHITHKRPFSPTTIRSFLAESITAFPTNTIFLSLYAWNESRFRIDDRVRGIMRDVVFSHRHHHTAESDNVASRSVIPYFFAIYTDLHRGVTYGSNQNAIRGSFERALRSEGAAHSASLWRLYLLFEYENGDLKRTRNLFYRAVRACPWVKEIYMLAFDCLANALPEEELRGVYEMMVEKELRIHVSL